MKKILCITLSFSWMFLTGCVNDGGYYRVLAACDGLIDEWPDSVAEMLESLEEDRVSSDYRMQMKYRLLRMRVQNSLDRPFMQIDSMVEVSDYYDKKGSETERLTARYLVGRAFYLQGDMMKAMDYYHQCLSDTIDTDDTKYNRLLSKVHSQMSLIFHEQKLPDLEENEVYSAEYAARSAGDTALAETFRCYLYGPYMLRDDHKGVIPL